MNVSFFMYQLKLNFRRFSIQKCTKRIVLISLWTSCVAGKEFYCPSMPDWANKTVKECVDYTQFDLVKEGFFVASARQILFETKGAARAYILLQNKPEEYSRNAYELVLGTSKNNMSILRFRSNGPRLDAHETPGILNETEYRSFWITWNTSLAIGQGIRIDINTMILFTRLKIPINSMRISYGCGNDGFFRFPEKSDNVASPQTTPTRRETSASQSTQKEGVTDPLLPQKGNTCSKGDVFVLAISTGCLVFMLLSTILGFYILWNKRKSTEIGICSYISNFKLSRDPFNYMYLKGM